MKLQLKLDLNTLQQLLLQNVEKLGVGLVLLLSLIIMASALSKAQRYDKSPEQLLQAVKTGENTLASSSAKPELTVTDYVALARHSRAPIEARPYLHQIAWDKPLFPKRPLRDRPPLLAVQQLRGTAEVGAFRINPAALPEAASPATDPTKPPQPDTQPPMYSPTLPGGSDVRGQRWVVITGLVPFEKQVSAFEETFRTSVYYDPQKDYPVYLGYWVQRVEVSSPGEAINPNWEKAKTIVSSKAMQAAMTQWSQVGSTDVVATEYLDQRLAFPLGPLVNRTWGESVAHPPEIPMLSSIEQSLPGMPGGLQPGGIPPRGMPWRPDMLPPPGPRGGWPGGSRGPATQPNTQGTPFDEGTPEAAQPGAPGYQSPEATYKTPPYLLLRFFDFEVEPGKHYVYRVKLGLQNPNCGLKANYLTDPKLAEKSWLETDWSEPSPVISVPHDTRVLAVSVKPPAKPLLGEANGRILITKWLRNQGMEAFGEFTVVRGQVANFAGEVFKIYSSGSSPMPGLGPMNPYGVPPAPTTPPTPSKPGSKPRGGTNVPNVPPEMQPPGIGPGMAPGLPGMPGMPPESGSAGRRSTRRQPGQRGETLPEFPTPPATATTVPIAALKVNYYTNMTVVDFRGGERLDTKRGGLNLTAPGKVLLVDADGNLIVRDELVDKPEYDKITSINHPPDMSGIAGGVPGVQPPVPPMGSGGLDSLIPPNPPRKKGGT